jgi:RNA polymerase sigma-70 factor (ECF subfamily)
MDGIATARLTGTFRLENDRDAELVGRFQAGELKAFDEIVATHQRRISNLVYRQIGWSNEVDDVVQDVFVCVLQNLYRFRGQAKFSTWLTRIAVNQCRSHLRRRMFRIRSLPRVLERFKTTLESNQRSNSEEKHEEIRQAVRSLPARYREPIVLRYFEQLSVPEIGEVLGLSTNTVEVRLSRARRKLKDALMSRSEKEQQ